MRRVHRTRKTKETSIDIILDLDSPHEGEIATGIAFFDHMLIAMVLGALPDILMLGNGRP